MNKAKHYVVSGRVQGVGFRYFTWREAQKIGVIGTVRNCADGCVEVIAQGSEKQLMEFEQWLKQGPKTAKVEHLQINDCEPRDYVDFSIIHR